MNLKTAFHGLAGLLATIAILVFPNLLRSAEPELSQMDPKQAGQYLAERLRAGAPTESTTLKGNLKIKRRGAEMLTIPFRFEARPGETNWRAIYQTASVGTNNAESLAIVHSPSQPNEYLYAKATKPGEQPGEPVRLTDDKAAIPLANSDFWLTDLGLEFAHWPNQRYVKWQMRESRGCYVLESTNPNHTGPGYSRVLSWIDQESGGILLAEAYDRTGKVLKDFRVRSVKKIEGQYQLQEMEITNDEARSTTRLEFVYDKKP